MRIPPPLRALAAALLLAGLSHGPASAADPGSAIAETAEPEEDAYGLLYATILAGADEEAMIDNQIETLKRTLETQDPNIAAIEAIEPGFLDAFGETMRPWMFEHSHRVQEMFKPRFMAALREELSAEDARRMAAFYGSPAGVKLLQGVTRNFTGANALGDLGKFDEDTIDPDDVDRDVRTAAMKAALSLSSEDYQDENAAVLRDPALMARMDKLGARIIALRHEMENAPMEPELEAGMEASIEALFEEYFPDDEGE